MTAPKPFEDRDNLKRSGAAIPKTELVANEQPAVELPIAVPPRNEPTKA